MSHPLLMLRARGAEVVLLQKLLNQRLPTKLASLIEDGDFGQKTDTRVREFQMLNRLEVDGKVGTQTWTQLEQPGIPAPVPPATSHGGLLINGKIVPVDGVFIIGQHDAAWAHLDPGDCRPRTIFFNGQIIDVWPQAWINHKTIADDPEKLLPGKGPTGGAQRTAEWWLGDPKHSGAHGVTGHDGIAACLADLVKVEAYCSNLPNTISVGWETDELVGGGFYEAAFRTTIAITLGGCRALGIQWQMPKLGSYKGRAMERMLDKRVWSMCGLFEHRNSSNDRDRWDAGDMFEIELAKHGVEQFNFEDSQDLIVWKDRQTELNKHGYNLTVNGVADRATHLALLSEGYRDGIYALGKAA